MQGLAVAFDQHVHAARAALVRDAGDLWGVDASATRWIGAHGGTWYLTDDPGHGNFRQRAGSLWTGPAPPDDRPANTSLSWNGARWARVELGDTVDCRLLLHEAWHAEVEPVLLPHAAGSEESVDGGNHLGRSAGRSWLRLELEALRRSLRANPGAIQDRAVAATLAFRLRRDAGASPAELRRQRRLEFSEGMAEYSAWRWAGATDRAVAQHVASAPPPSWVRSFCYRTGPAYGFLLDRLVPGWRRRACEGASLPAMLRDGVERVPAPEQVRGYDIERVLAEERLRDKEVDQQVRQARSRFFGSTVLRIPLEGAALVFDPREDLVVEGGTVRGHVRWSSGGTRLVADTALVAADWSELRVPLPPGALSRDRRQKRAEGPGWTLYLGSGHVLSPDAGGWILRRSG